MSYKNFGTKVIDIKNPQAIIEAYNDGYVPGRNETGQFNRVRSIRINLKEFEASSENRRILRKYEHQVDISKVPYANYTWEIHKMGKEFYDTKFGVGTFSANKIKELFCSTSTNFNAVLTLINIQTGTADGYCILVQATSHNQSIVHYAYPFYKLDFINSNLGIYMMTKTVQILKQQGIDYMYLGSVHEPASLYKLQFKGEEWWNEESNSWCTDMQLLKDRVRQEANQDLTNSSPTDL